MKLFVYGTLMSGFGLNSQLSSSKFLGQAQSKNNYSLHITGSIPYLHDDEADYTIVGELYEVELPILAKIDSIENNGEWYVRKPLSVIMANGEQIEAEAYFNNEKGKKLPEGDYRKYRNQTN